MKGAGTCVVTLGLILAALFGYGKWPPPHNTAVLTTLGDHLTGVLRHGNYVHLLSNCALIAIGGWLCETRIGAANTLVLAALSALSGTAAELYITGPGFIGMSSVAYGLLTCGTLARAAPEKRTTMALVIGLILAGEILFLTVGYAVYAHLFAAVTGGIFFMFNALFGSKGPALKKMEWQHVSDVIAIIAQTDEDDAAEAEEIFLAQGGLENMFVLIERGKVLGVTGVGYDDHIPDLAWLSWTYLDEAHHGHGLGGQMLNDLLGMLAKQGIRKLFIETSDHSDFGKKTYERAHKLYEDFGASLELTIPDYHAPGEAKLIFGLDNPEAPADVPVSEGEMLHGFDIRSVEKAPETDNVGGLVWEETANGLTGVDLAKRNMHRDGYRMLVLPIPDDLAKANLTELQKNGFEHVGELKDYYSKGLHQQWWVLKSGKEKSLS